ncbi:hypothetical protein FACS1894163_13450 [Spirochaetia bacterium]|nr:hypothetical protein FACS1894163_13450 [Spirochaetia bacterium]
MFAEDGLAIGGGVWTGLRITQESGGGLPDKDPVVDVMHGDGTPALYRMNFTYTKGNLQFKWRTQANSDGGTADQLQVNPDNIFAYAFATGSFYDDQILLSLGKLDGSPYESGGDDGSESANEGTTGIKAEWKPTFVKGLGLGIVLPAVINSYQPNIPQYFSEVSLLAKYDAEPIDVRFGIQFDGDGDGESARKPDGTIDHAFKTESGGKIIYGLNPKLGRIVDGLNVHVNGLITGIPTVDGVKDTAFTTQHWLITKFAKGDLSAALRLRFLTKDGQDADKSIVPFSLKIKPVFGYDITDWLNVGLVLQADLNFSHDEDYYTGYFGKKDFSVLDAFNAELGFEFKLPGGAAIKPVWIMDINPAYSVSAAADEAKITNQFRLNLWYSF